MSYILEAKSNSDVMARMVWVEGVGSGDEIKFTVANAAGTLAEGIGRADELETLCSTHALCVCSGDIWIERTSDIHYWNIAIVNSAHLGDISISAFEFTCALQRIHLDRLMVIGFKDLRMTGDPISEEELLTRHGLARSRAFACDS